MNNIFLIGYRCTGKTTVGRLLAEKLGRPFADSDAEVVSAYGMSITEMVAQNGWPFFREKERETIRRLCAMDNHIIATGGGVILDPENVRDMKNSGVVVWLRATPETIRDRILKDQQTEGQRPALTEKGLLGEIEEMLEFRNPLYEEAADISVETGHVESEAVSEIVIAQMPE